MNNRTRLRQLVIVSVLLWLLSAAAVGLWTYDKVSMVIFVAMLGLIAAAAVASLLMLNQSQKELSESNKQHSRTKRLVQESQLKIDRFEYDSKKSSELRRIVLNSTQEKDHSLRNMAYALDHAMDELIELSGSKEAGTMDQIRTRAEGMKQYAHDLQALAKLELKNDLPEHLELDFLEELDALIEDWNQFGKSRRVKVKLENREDQMPIYSDPNWIHNLLSRVVQSLMRMNDNTQLHMHLIGYLDADLGDALRVSFNIDGRKLSDEQLQRITTEYVSIVEDGQEIGPGLTFVVARRLAQMLNGFIDVTNSSHGMEVLVVLPRNPGFTENPEI